jgi:prephenate dehydrogenase
MWEAAGAVVNEMGVEHHDEVLAATSHLPHMLAFALVESLARMGEQREIFEYAAGGFRDFTRIASSDPVMWRDICIANRDALLAMLKTFRGDLDDLATAIQDRDEDKILSIFRDAKAARDAFEG